MPNSRKTLSRLCRLYGEDSVQIALKTQEGYRRGGCGHVGLERILQGLGPKPVTEQVEDIQYRQLRRRGMLGAAALTLDQAALLETDPDKAEKIREVAQQAKALSERPKQLDFFDLLKGGNVVLGNMYIDAVMEKLHGQPRDAEALKVLVVCIRHLRWQSFVVDLDGVQAIAEKTYMRRPNVSRALTTLERIGAIRRRKDGRRTIIEIDPEAAYRGKIENQPTVSAAFHTGKVVPLNRRLGQVREDVDQ